MPTTPPPHILSITQGAKNLADSMIRVAAQKQYFKTPADNLRAGLLQELFESVVPHAREISELDPSAKVTPEVQAMFDAQTKFSDKAVKVSLTEKQRDFLKGIVKDHAAFLPLGKHSRSLQTALGFTEDDG